ncbi:ABC transporter ATP-binding protein [Anaerostipes sp.]|uniref:ABC transporter ATP-binding protein n=1 Tax=Anaerostipes sp. TaxID=1872530 RepID=UPI0025C51C62|nr:ABC transporter ATP-binding protein [Anaerostipes sp.]MBS7007700.1 ABC transporter ATP-binding protein [Anaerostipes sp.]
MTEKKLEIQSLKKYYGKKGNLTKALDGISFQVADGEFIGIMGSSGSGKTTLLNCISTASHPTGGKILLKGQEIWKFTRKDLENYRGRQMGYLFQNFELIGNLTAEENIMLPAEIHNEGSMEQRMHELAACLEIEDILDKFPSELSGGQKQRTAAARALLLNPELLLADEPTGALDSKNARLLMQKLSELNREQKTTILMVTHDANVASYCSRILFIRDGIIFHQLRKKVPEESGEEFYERIIAVMAQLGGGSANGL